MRPRLLPAKLPRIFFRSSRLWDFLNAAYQRDGWPVTALVHARSRKASIRLSASSPAGLSRLNWYSCGSGGTRSAGKKRVSTWTPRPSSPHYLTLRHNNAVRVKALVKQCRQLRRSGGRNSHARARMDVGRSQDIWPLSPRAEKNRAKACLGASRNSSTMATRCTQGIVQ